MNTKGGVGATLQIISLSTMTFAGSACTQARLEPRSDIGLTDAEMMLLSYHCRLSDTPTVRLPESLPCIGSQVISQTWMIGRDNPV